MVRVAGEILQLVAEKPELKMRTHEELRLQIASSRMDGLCSRSDEIQKLTKWTHLCGVSCLAVSIGSIAVAHEFPATSEWLLMSPTLILSGTTLLFGYWAFRQSGASRNRSRHSSQPATWLLRSWDSSSGRSFSSHARRVGQEGQVSAITGGGTQSPGNAPLHRRVPFDS